MTDYRRGGQVQTLEHPHHHHHRHHHENAAALEAPSLPMPQVSHHLYPIHESPVRIDREQCYDWRERSQHYSAPIHSRPKPRQCESANPPMMIQITPTMTARLRGARETQACIENDFYIPTSCFCCEANIFCIQDANYVLCPECKVVSPLSDGADPEFDGGVGLGFTFADLQQCTEEILARRRGV